MLSCRDVTKLISSDALARGSWRQRAGVRLHLMMCRHCSRYAAQLRTIAAEARRKYDQMPNVSELQKSILEALRKK